MLQLKGKKGSAAQNAMTKALGGRGKVENTNGVDMGKSKRAVLQADTYRSKKKKEHVWGGTKTEPKAKPRAAPMLRGKTEAQRGEDEDKEAENSDSDSDSGFSDFGDDEAVLAKIHAKRMLQMKAATNKQLELKQKGHGEYQEISEPEFLDSVTKSMYCVCHFYHKDFVACKVVDKHLRILAKKHVPTRFINIDAEKTPFFVKKLQIKVLPCVIFFKDGVAIDRLVGLEELGGDMDFTTRLLEKRLAIGGVILVKDVIDKDAEDWSRRTNSIRTGTLISAMDDIDLNQ